MDININNDVKVKLTDHGKDILKANFNELNVNGFLGEYRPPRIDQDGYTKFQLWVLMNEFGQHMHNGCKIPFETKIVIDSN